MQDSSPTPVRGGRRLFLDEDVGGHEVTLLEDVRPVYVLTFTVKPSESPDQGVRQLLGRASVILQLSRARKDLANFRKRCYALEVELVKEQSKLSDYARFDDKRFRRAAEILVCPLCMETFQTPWILTECGHTFCEACIAGHFALVEDSCPQCNVAITTPPVEDFHTIQLLDIFVVKPGADPTKRSGIVGKWDKWFRARAPADNRKIGGDFRL